MKRLLPLFISFLAVAVIFFAWPRVALAQEPTCVPITSTTYHLSDYVDSDAINPPTNPENALGEPDGLLGDFYAPADNTKHWSFSLPYVVSGTVVISSTVTIDGDVWNTYLYVHPEKNASVNDAGWIGGQGSLDRTFYNQVVGSIKYGAKGKVAGGGYIHLDGADIVVTGCYYPAAATCSTVQDYHFTGAITDTWLLSGSATISDSILTLTPGDAAGQNLDTLTSNTNYNAVISVTEILSDTTVPLLTVLGIETDTVTIVGPGLYFASLSTPNLGGPVAYILNNESLTGTVKIDYTCLYATTGQEPVCIAPTNGEFNGPDNWNWYRGATYQPLLNNAYLPFNEGDEDTKSLLMTSGTYTMPSLAENEYLLMSFTSETQLNEAAVLGARATNGITDTTYYFEIYAYPYGFEADISDLADLTGVSLAFVNVGEDPVTGFAAEDNIYLDDVCIFVSDDSPDLPGPVDPDPIYPDLVDNWTCYTCADVPGILLGYGLSVYFLEEIYQNGVAVWDPSGWVPWLAAALWVHAGHPLACFILALWCWLLGLIMYLLNEALNWLHWGRSSLLSFLIWLALLIAWINASATDWLNWASQTLVNLVVFWFYNLWNIGRWIGEGFIWLANNIPGFDLIIQAWNWLVPWLEGIWSYISSVSLLTLLISLLLSLVSAGWSLFLMLITWLWENIFQGISLPLDFYRAFDEGIQQSSFDYLLSCESQNFWCSLLAGFQLVNESAGHSIMYPAIIVGIIVTSLLIFWNDIRALFGINVK